MGIDGFGPLVKEAALGVVLLRILSLGFENEHRSVGEADEKIGSVLLHDAAIDVKNLKSQVVVLHPGLDGPVVVEFVGLGRLPRAIEDAKVYVASLGPFARSARVPRPHVAGGADGVRCYRPHLGWQSVSSFPQS